MEKYYVDGKKITEKEAKEIERKNNEYINSGNFADLKESNT